MISKTLVRVVIECSAGDYVSSGWFIQYKNVVILCCSFMSSLKTGWFDIFLGIL